jgi:hypothetical protein
MEIEFSVNCAGVPRTFKKSLPIVFGRAQGVNIRVSDPQVSRYHCLLEACEGKVVAKDLNSTNGTFINGTPITTTTLSTGDKLRIGDMQFELQFGAINSVDPSLHTGSALVPEGRDSQPASVAIVGTGAASPTQSIAVTVGFDFGTYATKVLIRRRGNLVAEAIRIDQTHSDYPPCCCPSVVGIKNDRLYFGATALSCMDEVFHSLKIAVLDRAASPIHYDMRSDGMPLPEHLMAMYLAWSFGLVKRRLDERYGADSTRVDINLAAPMTYYEDRQLKDRYLRIIQAAWQCSFGTGGPSVEQGERLTEVRKWFVSRLDDDVPIDPIEQRRFEVKPETIAPLVSLAQDPRAGEGMYFVLDMGAGTTEMSVNYLQSRSRGCLTLCYQDETIRLGGNDFQSASSDQERRPHLDRLLTHFRRTWARGYRKDSPNPATRGRWKRLTVLLTGGASRRSMIEDSVRSHHQILYPWHASSESGTRYDVKWLSPVNIDFTDIDQPGDSDSSSLLAVAHGLSVPRQRWQEYCVPSDVETQEAVTVEVQTEPYWYL